MLDAPRRTTLPDMRITALFVVGILGLVGCAGAEGQDVAATSQEVRSPKVLLDCSVFLSGGGPDQQVIVEQRGEDLVLRELTNHGSWESRPLSREEWESRDLKLRNETYDPADAVNRLYVEDGYWMNESKSPGWHAFGYADCSHP